MLLTTMLSTPFRLAYFFQSSLISQATFFKHNFFHVITSPHFTLVLRSDSDFYFETAAKCQRRLWWKVPCLQAKVKEPLFCYQLEQGSSNQDSFLYLQERTSPSKFPSFLLSLGYWACYIFVHRLGRH